jgi:hypothetical protein
MTLLIMALAYRYILERPLPWFENARMEADLTRLGIWIRRRLGFPTLAVDPQPPTVEGTLAGERESPPER